MLRSPWKNECQFGCNYDLYYFLFGGNHCDDCIICKEEEEIIKIRKSKKDCRYDWDHYSIFDYCSCRRSLLP